MAARSRIDGLLLPALLALAAVAAVGPGRALPSVPLESWAAHIDGGYATKVVVSPDSSRVFVIGNRINNFDEFATAAYDAKTGAQLWLVLYGPRQQNRANDLAVAPDGSRVFVTGRFSGVQDDYGTVAFDAGDGSLLWAARYDGSGNDYDSAVAVGATGSHVVVTGSSTGAGTATDYATVAYDSTSGAQIWAARYNGPANSFDGASRVVFSPDASRVLVTGSSRGSGGSDDYATLAYNASNGAQQWAVRYDGPQGSWDTATEMVMAPNGSRVFVSGTSFGSDYDYATVAYDSATGAQQWLARFGGSGDDAASGLAVAPDGSRIFVTGSSELSATVREHQVADTDFHTIAYDAAAGSQIWETRYRGVAHEAARDLAVSPDGARVFVTGASFRDLAVELPCLVGCFHPIHLPEAAVGYYATLAYDVSNGVQAWEARYDEFDEHTRAFGLRNRYASASMAASPDGQRVFVTGLYATIAYCAWLPLPDRDCEASDPVP